MTLKTLLCSVLSATESESAEPTRLNGVENEEISLGRGAVQPLGSTAELNPPPRSAELLSSPVHKHKSWTFFGSVRDSVNTRMLQIVSLQPQMSLELSSELCFDVWSHLCN